MTASTIGTPAEKAGTNGWPRGTWLLAVVLAFMAQVGLIFLFGARQPISTETLRPAPATTLATTESTLVALTDPTVFVLPSGHGFSGEAWDMTPHTRFIAPEWTEPIHWLAPAADRLGESFKQLVANEINSPADVAAKMPPRTAPLVTIPPAAMPAQSTLRVEGDIASRALVTPVVLPSWANGDILPPSEVQVIVDVAGRVVSTALLASSELVEADQRALEVARAARFEPAPDGRELTWGRLRFAWRTVPLQTIEEPTSTPP